MSKRHLPSQETPVPRKDVSQKTYPKEVFLVRKLLIAMSVEKKSSLATDPTDIWNASNLPEGFRVQHKHVILSTPCTFDSVKIITHKNIIPISYLQLNVTLQLVPKYGLGHYLKIAMLRPPRE